MTGNDYEELRWKARVTCREFFGCAVRMTLSVEKNGGPFAKKHCPKWRATVRAVER